MNLGIKVVDFSIQPVLLSFSIPPSTRSIPYVLSVFHFFSTLPFLQVSLFAWLYLCSPFSMICSCSFFSFSFTLCFLCYLYCSVLSDVLLSLFFFSNIYTFLLFFLFLLFVFVSVSTLSLFFFAYNCPSCSLSLSYFVCPHLLSVFRVSTIGYVLHIVSFFSFFHSPKGIMPFLHFLLSTLLVLSDAVFSMLFIPECYLWTLLPITNCTVFSYFSITMFALFYLSF